MKKVIAFTISIILVLSIVLLIIFKIGLFKEGSNIIFKNQIREVKYDKPEINKDHTFIKGYSKSENINNIKQEILAYYYYDEIDNSEYEIDSETGEETVKAESKAYYLIRELYINGNKVGETSKIDYSNEKDMINQSNNDFDSIKTNKIIDIDNDKEYLILTLTDNIMNTGLTYVKTSAVYIINEDYEIIQELANGNSTGYVNIPIYKDELGDRNYLNGINTFNKMFNTEFDYLLYSENGYVDILKKKIYYIDVNASKCEIDEHEIKISNGEIKDSYSKTYPDVSKYVTGDGYC